MLKTVTQDGIAAKNTPQFKLDGLTLPELNQKQIEWLYQTSDNADKIAFKSTQSGEDFDNAAAIAWFKKWL